MMTYSTSLLPMFTTRQFEEMLRVALELHREGQWTEAEAILVGLMAMRPDDPRPIKLLATILLLDDRHREAETLFERVRTLDAEDPYVLVALGEIKLNALKLQEAIPLFERLFALDPEAKHPAANRGRSVVKTYYQKLLGQGGGQ